MQHACSRDNVWQNGLMYSFNPDTGRVPEARRLDSPNCDARPGGCTADLIVVHGISLPPNEFGGDWIDRLFTNTLDHDAHPYFREIAGLQVSAHFLIRRDGELVQFVPTTQRAWHAGQSDHCGRECCNDFSIGIELEGADLVPYEPVQYLNLAALIDTLRREVSSLADADIVGHSDIAPGRKTDPGPAFDWPRLRGLLERPIG